MRQREPGPRDTDNLAQTLLTLREARGLTHAEVAEACGVLLQTVVHWERGYSLVPVVHFSDLARVLHVSVRTLITQRTSDFRNDLINRLENV